MSCVKPKKKKTFKNMILKEICSGHNVYNKLHTEYHVCHILQPKVFFTINPVIPVGGNVMLLRFPFIFPSQLGDILT